jgi:hypothetical protein
MRGGMNTEFMPFSLSLSVFIPPRRVAATNCSKKNVCRHLIFMIKIHVFLLFSSPLLLFFHYGMEGSARLLEQGYPNNYFIYFF